MAGVGIDPNTGKTSGGSTPPPTNPGENPYGGGIKAPAGSPSTQSFTASPSGWDTSQYKNTTQNQARAQLKMQASLGWRGTQNIEHHTGWKPMGTTQLLLKAVGYNANGAGDLEATVARVDKLAADAGYDSLTPGAVMDLVGNPIAHNPAALGRLFTNQLGGQAMTSAMGLPGEQSIGSVQQDLKQAFSTAVAVAFLAPQGSKESGILVGAADVHSGAQPLTDVSNNLQAGTGTINDAIKLVQTIPMSQSTATGMVYGSKFLAGQGFDYSSLGNNYDENIRILKAKAAATGTNIANPRGIAGIGPEALKDGQARVGLGPESTVQPVLDAAEQFHLLQQKMIKLYHLKDVTASGFMNQSWPTIFKNLQSNKSYQTITQLNAVQQAGYGNGKFDPFSSVDMASGKITDPVAATELARWLGSVKGRQESIAYYQHKLPGGFDVAGLGIGSVIEAMPLGAFNKGGVSLSSTAGYLLGGNDGAWQAGLSPGALIGDLTHPSNAFDYVKSGGMFGGSGSIENILVRSGTYSFGIMNGTWTQAKRTLFAGEALLPQDGLIGEISRDAQSIAVPGAGLLLTPFSRKNDLNWNQRKAIAYGRIGTAGPAPSWMDIAANDPHAADHLAKWTTDVTGVGREYTDAAAATLDFGSNALVDFWATKDLSLFGGINRGKELMQALGDSDKAALVVNRSAEIQQTVRDSFRDFAGTGSEGKKWGRAITRFDGNADDFAAADQALGEDGKWYTVEHTQPHGPQTGTDMLPGPTEPLDATPAPQPTNAAGTIGPVEWHIPSDVGDIGNQKAWVFNLGDERGALSLIGGYSIVGQVPDNQDLLHAIFQHALENGAETLRNAPEMTQAPAGWYWGEDELWHVRDAAANEPGFDVFNRKLPDELRSPSGLKALGETGQLDDKLVEAAKDGKLPYDTTDDLGLRTATLKTPVGDIHHIISPAPKDDPEFLQAVYDKEAAEIQKMATAASGKPFEFRDQSGTFGPDLKLHTHYGNAEEPYVFADGQNDANKLLRQHGPHATWDATNDIAHSLHVLTDPITSRETLYTALHELNHIRQYLEGGDGAPNVLDEAGNVKPIPSTDGPDLTEEAARAKGVTISGPSIHETVLNTEDDAWAGAIKMLAKHGIVPNREDMDVMGGVHGLGSYRIGRANALTDELKKVGLNPGNHFFNPRVESEFDKLREAAPAEHPATFGRSPGQIGVTVLPGKLAYFHNVEIAKGADAENVLTGAVRKARQGGATEIAPSINGVTRSGRDMHNQLYELAASGAYGMRVLGGAPEWIEHAGDYVLRGGRVMLKPALEEDTVEEAQDVMQTARDQLGRDVYTPDELQQALDNPEANGQRKLYTVAEAINHPTNPMSRDEFNGWVTDKVTQGKFFHGQRGGLPPTVVPRQIMKPGWRSSDTLLHPGNLVPHPLRALHGNSSELYRTLLAKSERSLAGSKMIGTTTLGNFQREMTVFFTRAANGNSLPLTEYDSRNIWRAAREVGLPRDYADSLQARFIMARAKHDAADLQKIQNTLTWHGVQQGREFKDAAGMGSAFSGGVDRTAEHELYQAKDAKIFGPDGLLATRQWAAISAARPEMTRAEAALAHEKLRQEISDLGLHPIEAKGVYGGETGKSWFVPGMWQSEAHRLAVKYEQESVLGPKGLLYAAKDPGDIKLLHGASPVEGPSADGQTTMKLGGKTVEWHMPIEWDGIPSKGHEIMQSLPAGEAKILTKREALQNLLDSSDNEDDRTAISEALANGDRMDSPAPMFTSEMFHNFSLPIVNQARNQGLIGQVNRLNHMLLVVGRVNRRLLLTADPMLFWKHASADSIRRMIGEGGTTWRQNAADYPHLAKYLADNPDKQAIFDELVRKSQSSELHYNNGEDFTGAEKATAFWTNNEDFGDARWGVAAGYIHRRIMDGAYQAYKEGGTGGVAEFFSLDPKGIKLAEDEDMDPRILGALVGRNIETITNVDPTFLDRAEQIIKEAKPGKVRATLTKYMRDANIAVPVTGHISNETLHNLSWLAKADDASGHVVEFYMTANKLNKGGLMKDIASAHYANQTGAGVDSATAFDNAVSIANKVVRYHMLDLADALKAEQAFRWADYFLTKHRLYWTWIMKSMAQHPGYAVTFSNFQKLLDAHGGDASQMTVNLPGFAQDALKAAGVKSAGPISYTIPLARLLWLDSSNSVQPGAFASGWNALQSGDWENAIPFTNHSTVDATTIDTSIKYATFLGLQKFTDHVHTSDEVLSHLNAQDAYKFKLAYWRIYAGGIAHHAWKNMTGAEIDAKVTHAAMKSQLITTLWRNSAFSGGYINDPKLSSAQDKIWQQYNNMVDPKQKADLRAQYPFINGQLGIYNSSAQQHVKSNKMWDTYTAALGQHEKNQMALLDKFRTTGNPADLFGPAWHAESARYEKQYNQIKAMAAKIGATDFGKQMSNDQLMAAYAGMSGQLHKLFPMDTPAQIKKVIDSKGKQPAWVNIFQGALDTTYSPAGIKALPEDFQGTAYSVASYYKTRLMEYEENPAKENAAEKLRNDYFSKVYGPYKGKLQDLYKQIATTIDPSEASHLYDVIRAYQDAHSGEVNVDGTKFPNTQEMEWVMLPKDAQASSRQAWALHNWSWLTGFQKKALGVPVSPGVQSGWTQYNNFLYSSKSQYAKNNAGKQLYITDEQKLYVAQQVNAEPGHHGFLADYTRSLTPAYQRILNHPDLYGGSTRTKKDWKGLMKQVGISAASLTGTHLPSDATGLMAWNADFRKEYFQQLITSGVSSVDHGIPIATGPTKEYPQGGWFYRWAAKQGNPEFMDQLNQQLHNNPKYIATLFTPGG